MFINIGSKGSFTFIQCLFIITLIKLIFLSALYYLLSYSKECYLPLKFISDLTPTVDNNPSLQSIYTSVENGISSVFAVTLKMACFYGFYTSLTHTICGVNLVVIPSSNKCSSYFHLLIHLAILCYLYSLHYHYVIISLNKFYNNCLVSYSHSSHFSSGTHCRNVLGSFSCYNRTCIHQSRIHSCSCFIRFSFNTYVYF